MHRQMSPSARRAPEARPLGARLLAGACVLLTGLALCGCGLGAGPAPGGVRLTVTSDFGARVLRELRAPKVSGQETVMSLLMRNAAVATRYGGGFVQSIDGLGGGEGGGRPLDWFYYVNGVASPKGASATVVHAGDRIWWDRHDWSQTDSIPAVVGSFPQPFVSGIDGKRLPVRLECARVESSACRTIASRLRALGVLAGLASIGPADEPETLRVVVGPWSAVRVTGVGPQLQRGPRASGVYARFSADGSTLTLLDEGGATARTLTAGAGLLAATRYGTEAPVWVVTGTDESGVGRAADAFDQATLENRFAVVLSPTGAVLPAPAPG
jgi:Domain of unknown function (DUF4430)